MLIFLQTLIIFLPNITFGLISSDIHIFPWPILLLLINRLYNNLNFIFFIFFITIFSFISFVKNESPEIIDILRSCGIYLNIISSLFLAEYFVKNKKYDLSFFIKVLSIIYILFIVIGTVQFFSLDNNFKSLLELLIPNAKYIYSSETDPNRGIYLLASEPARAICEVLTLTFVLRNLLLIENKIKWSLIIDISSFIFTIFVFKAITGLVLFGIYAISSLFIYKGKNIYFKTFKLPISLTYILIALPICIYVVFNITQESRMADVGLTFLRGDLSLKEKLFDFINIGGHRYFTLTAALIYPFSNIFGGGIGSWKTTSIDAFKNLNIDSSNIRYFIVHGGGDLVSTRSPGILGHMTMEFGLLGFLIFFIIFLRISKWRFISFNFRYFALANMFFFFSRFILFSGTGDPIGPFLFCLSSLLIFDKQNKIIKGKDNAKDLISN